MTALDPDMLNRTLKLELDEGRAASIEEAQSLAKGYRLQIAVGSGIVGSPTRQAMLLTAVNAGVRAFPGGVSVWTDEDPIVEFPWGRGQRLSSVLDSLGASRTTEPDGSAPTILIGRSTSAYGGVLICPTCKGWAAGVLDSPARPLSDLPEFPLSGVLAGALAVSEAFQSIRGNVEAGRREVGLSLWRPDLDWQADEAAGPECRYLPSRWWLLGLGHLGQAYAWAIGSLPFAEPTEVQVYLQDPQTLVQANWSTGLLVRKDAPMERKTRLVARRLETLGLETSIVERRFDEHMCRRPDEPGLALAGFDHPGPRRVLQAAGFEHIVDAGLGHGSRYLDMTLHTLPSSRKAEDIWPATTRSSVEHLLSLPAYEGMIENRVQEGVSREAAACGLTELAGRTVGAAFVGAAAATLVVADPLRLLNGGLSFETVGLSLNSLKHRQVVENSIDPPSSLGYVEAYR
jgi:hypothetical protein